jgi:hypothetical protein
MRDLREPENDGESYVATDFVRCHEVRFYRMPSGVQRRPTIDPLVDASRRLDDQPFI